MFQRWLKRLLIVLLVWIIPCWIVRSNAQVSLFLPTSIPNCTLWLDATDQTTLYQSGARGSLGTQVSLAADPVGLWLDKSGQNNDVSASSSKPAWSTGVFTQAANTGFSALGAVTFTGTSGAATPLKSTGSFLNAGYNQAFTLFVVRAGEPSFAPSIEVGDSAGHTYFACGTSTMQQSLGSATAGTIYASSGAQNGDASAFAIDMWEYDGITLTVAHNGKPLRRGYTGNIGFTGQNILIGSYNTGTSYGFNGSIGEVLVYNRALTQAEVGKVAIYESAKWGISVPTGTQIACAGNSLTIGFRTIDAKRFPGGDYPSQLAQQLNNNSVACTVLNQGYSGYTGTYLLAQARNNGASAFANVYINHKTTLTNSFLAYWEITNDLVAAVNAGNPTGGVADNPVQAFNNVRDYCLQREQEGYRVIVLTCLPRNAADYAGSNTNWNADRLAVNSAIKQLYNTSGSATVTIGSNTYTGSATPFAAIVADVASDTILTNDWTAGNTSTSGWTSGVSTTYWQKDGTHLTPAGYNRISIAVYNAILTSLSLPTVAPARTLH